MVFSSIEFLLFFLPIAVTGYHLFSYFRLARAAVYFLFTCSLVYYAWWNPFNIYIIISSMCFNFTIGRLFSKTNRMMLRKLLLYITLVVNIGSLGFYKYLDFSIANINSLFHAHLPLQAIILPIGVSFFTFQQIAYIVDTYRGHNFGWGFINYGLFVTFFPHLVAGPLVHHEEMIPQFANARNQAFRWDNFYTGLVVLFIGLAKKVVVADFFIPIVMQGFDNHATVSFLEAWLCSLSYTLQLYFDFSGYSDMAIGCALFFNIHLPENFNSPYKSLDLQDFWRRWHITLSRWLLNYLYIPLGGNRISSRRTLINLFLTFLLGGLWHGAAWTFVAWGALHGFGLIMHRVWSKQLKLKMPKVAGWAITFLTINAAWVLFRAPSFGDAKRIFAGMLGLHGFAFSPAFVAAATQHTGTKFIWYCLATTLALLVTWFLPSTRELRERGVSAPLTAWATALYGISFYMLCQANRISEFIYFQF